MTEVSGTIARTHCDAGGLTGCKLHGRVLAVASLMLLAVGSGCGDKSASVTPPPPSASVAHPLQREVVEWDNFSGHLQSPEVANVAARVSGLIMLMPFVEGAVVKRGDLLAVIDDRPFKADLDSKLADEQKAESTLAIARITFDRMVTLMKKNAVAEQEFDNARAACDQAAAAVAGAKAAVASSRLNLEWCRVLSPIDGRVGDKLVTVGNLVTGGAGQAPPTLLTTVTSIDPMYCYVDVDEHSILKYQKLAAERRLLSARDGKLPCFIGLENESDYPRKGSIDFMDNHVDPATGTIRVRAVVENTSGQLIPGCYARLRVPGSGRYRTLLVPDEAVGSDQSQHTVLVVDKENNVQVRTVQLGALFGRLRTIVSGISDRRPRHCQWTNAGPSRFEGGCEGDADRSWRGRSFPIPERRSRSAMRRWTRSAPSRTKGDSPIFAGTKIGTVPIAMPATALGQAAGAGR